MKEFTQERIDVWWKPDFIERVRHQLQPALAGGAVDGKGHVPHAKARVAALLDVTLGTTEPANEEIPEALLGPGEIRTRIHGTEDVVRWDLPVKRGDQTMKAVFADGGIDLVLFHDSMLTREGKSLTPPLTRYPFPLPPSPFPVPPSIE